MVHPWTSSYHLVGAFLCPLLNLNWPQYLQILQLVTNAVDYLILDSTPIQTRWDILLLFGVVTAVCYLGVSQYHVVVVMANHFNPTSVASMDKPPKKMAAETSDVLSLVDRSQLLTYPRKKTSKKYKRPKTSIEIHHETVIVSFLWIWDLSAYAVMVWILGFKFVISLVYSKCVYYRNFGGACLCLGLAVTYSSFETYYEKRLARSIADGLIRHMSRSEESYNVVKDVLSWIFENINKAVSKSML